MNVGEYLPLDAKSANFDNIADAQLLSPTLMQGYLTAAAEISRLAVRLHEVARSDVVAALVAAGIRVETVTARHRLEDAFLELVRADP